MKTVRFTACFFLLAALAGCRHPEIEIVDFDTFHVTSAKLAPVLMKDGSLNPEIQIMEEPDLDEPDTKLAQTDVNSIARNLLGCINCNTLWHISGTFTGHDVDGVTPLVQSGKLLLPKEGPVRNLVIVSHYTIGADYEAPSRCFPLEGIFAARGYAVVMADYIGYGETAGRIHPYMHMPSTARSVIDMALAVKPYLEHIGRAPESDEVILAGYSQGGATTIGVMKILQEEYADKFPIKQVYAGGGPYDLAATYDISMELDRTGIPCAIPMIVQGVNVGDNLGLNMGDFFQPGLLAHYKEWINSKTYTVKQINKLMGARTLHELMTDEGRDKTSFETARLYHSLLNNSVLNFVPQAPVFLFHSKDDTTVPFINAQKAEEKFKGCNIEMDFDHYGKHGVGCVRFVLAVNKKL